MRLIFSSILFAFLSACILFAQAQTTEYTYIYEKEHDIKIKPNEDSYPYEYKLDFGIQRRDMPLVNRLVRFTSATPDTLLFDNSSESIIVTTDENGYASANASIMSNGKSIVLVHLLYVGANTKITNISHEEYMTLYASSSNNSLIFDNPQSPVVLYNIFVPYLLLAVVSLFLVGYFKRLRKGEEYPSIAEVMMATLFGFSSIKNRFAYMIPFFLVEIGLFYIMILTHKSYFPILCLILAMTSYFVPRDRAYAVFFMLFAMLTIVHYISFYLAQSYTSNPIFEKFSFVGAWYFLIPFFVFLTAFFSNLYIPFALLSLMYIIFPFTPVSVHFAMIGIVIGCIIFMLKRIYNFRTFIFYKLNILKVDI